MEKSLLIGKPDPEALGKTGLQESLRRHRNDRDEATPPTVWHWRRTVIRNCFDSRGVGGRGVLFNTDVAINIDFFEQRSWMRKCGLTPALTIFVAYVPKSSYELDEAFYMNLENFYRGDHTFYKVIIGDFKAKIGPRRTPEELDIVTPGLQWNEQVERLSEFIMTTKTIHGNSQFQKPFSLRWT
ncbi:hypothetical protein RB195_012190 [Necator americanus]|uniref:Piwi domain-containing protein n=1 Tax=Necator americanus TaxID=51031 RepID=A0ABR1D6V3_NECAM